ncbi:hypothetical protein DFH07DRAFT_901286 [Mycena maculata]|uniref:NmrA-like domain-containing protein n=1 Tax=Mycena maculata TaxID=230809 RepID=A0AAD7NXL7_9AGAR|nr:hypothetical protein DFH07DRAFT_901286 [Mycena maculata]
MFTHKSFAVVGGGTIGLPIVRALTSYNVSVVLLSRPGSPSKTVPSTVKVVQVDFNDVAATAAVFKRHKIDVVVATIGKAAVLVQKSLADAAKLAAVKLFVPSEFATPTDGEPEGSHNPVAGIGDKCEVAEYLKSHNIPSARVFTGVFIESLPWLVGYSEHGKIRIVGKGEAPVSYTSVHDIAGFVAHVVTTLPPSALKDRIFRLQGDRASLNDLGAQFKTSVEHVDRITGEGGAVKTELLTLLSSGAGSTAWDETNQVERTGNEAAGSANVLWPMHRWRSIREVHNL